LGADYNTLRAENEGLVYAHVTGYGETGPAAGDPGMNANIQQISGFASLNGFEGDPPIRAQSPLADYYAGYNTAVSVLAALYHRLSGGNGQKVDVSLLESLMHNMDAAFEMYHNVGYEPPRGGRKAFENPEMLYGAAEAADGWVCVALLLSNERFWRGYCELLDRPDLLADPRYETPAGRTADLARLTAGFEAWLSEKPVDEAVSALLDVGIPAAPHNTVQEASDLERSHTGRRSSTSITRRSVASRYRTHPYHFPRPSPLSGLQRPVSVNTPTRCWWRRVSTTSTWLSFI